jgi:hypothetical protein
LILTTVEVALEKDVPEPEMVTGKDHVPFSAEFGETPLTVCAFKPMLSIHVNRGRKILFISLYFYLY